MSQAQQVTVINRTQFEITLPTDTVKDGKLVKTPVKFTRSRRDGSVVEGESNLITFDGMPKGSFKPNPVVLEKGDWERIAKHKAVAGYVAEGKLEVR